MTDSQQTAWGQGEYPSDRSEFLVHDEGSVLGLSWSREAPLEAKALVSIRLKPRFAPFCCDRAVVHQRST
jgi:hypothetical protein